MRSDATFRAEWWLRRHGVDPAGWSESRILETAVASLPDKEWNAYQLSQQIADVNAAAGGDWMQQAVERERRKLEADARARMAEAEQQTTDALNV